MPRTLARRLVPLQVAVGLQGMILWVPVEKLFMTQIGFTPRSVGVMAAAYAAVVPLLEVPSGILADRWSRNQILVCASVALLASSLLGGLSTNVPTYIAAAMILGIYFALNSGTVDSIVYDVVLEETGSSDAVRNVDRPGPDGRERRVRGQRARRRRARRLDVRTAHLLRVDPVRRGSRSSRSCASTSPACTAPRNRSRCASTSRLTVPDDDPRHRPSGRSCCSRRWRRLLSQAVFEFGPLWLVALARAGRAVRPVLGGARLHARRWRLPDEQAQPRPPRAVLTCSPSPPRPPRSPWRRPTSLVAVIAAQAVLALVLAIIGIRAGKLLHDGVPSNVRAGVSSGVGTVVLAAVPAVLAGVRVVRPRLGVHAASWLLTAAATLVALLLIAPRSPARCPPVSAPAHEEFACKQLVEIVTDYLDGVLPPALKDDFQTHIADCDGCDEYVRQIGVTIRALKQADLHLAPTAAREADHSDG